MILEALVKRYENQAAEGKISRQGWSKAKVAFGLRLSESGEIADVIDLRTEEKRGKKIVLISKNIEVPEQTKKANCHKNFFRKVESGDNRKFSKTARLYERISKGRESCIYV